MNTFKICRGLEANLPAMKNNGAIYFCKDTSNLYIDYLNENGELERTKFAAGSADNLRYIQDGEVVEIDASEVASINYVDNSIANQTTETWTFTLSDGSTVTKSVVIK